MLELLNLAGIFVFAISGALLAVGKRLDVIGMIVLAEITALGGGVLRDLIIDASPPAAFTGPSNVLVPLAAAAIVFFWHPQVERVLPAVLVFDAAGLGLFSATGALKALDYAFNPPAAVILGVCTAVGGGILRDLIAGQVPAVLYDRQLYIIPALTGAATATIAHELDARGFPLILGAALLTFLLRIAAMRYGWRAPLARGVREPE